MRQYAPILEQLDTLHRWQDTLPQHSALSAGGIKQSPYPDELLKLLIPASLPSGSYCYTYNIPASDRCSELLDTPPGSHIYFANSSTSLMKMLCFFLRDAGCDHVAALAPLYPPWVALLNALGMTVTVCGDVGSLLGEISVGYCAVLLHQPLFGTAEELTIDQLSQIGKYASDRPVLFDCTMSPTLSFLNNTSSSFEHLFVITSPLKVLGINSTKVAILAARAPNANRLDDLFYEFGDDLSQSTQHALSALFSEDFLPRLRAVRRITSRDTANSLSAIAERWSVSIDAAIDHYYCNITVPAYKMRRFFELEAHQELYRRHSVTIVPSGFYAFHSEGTLRFRINTLRAATQLRAIDVVLQHLSRGEV